MKEKEFDTVKTLREIKEKISMDLFGKSAQEIKDYLQQRTLNSAMSLNSELQCYRKLKHSIKHKNPHRITLYICL